MNVKKRLEQEANATHQKILEESDKSFLSSLQEQVSEPKRRPVFFHWKAWLTGAACSLAAALVIVCTVLFIPFKKQVVYLEKNFHTSASDVSALNADLKDFAVIIGEDLIVTDIKKTVDGPSGDSLFYVLALRTADRRIQTRLTIVCNQYFNYEDQYTLSYQQAQLSDYNVHYYIENSVNPAFQCYNINAYAKIEGTTEIIYITQYQEIALDENGTLFEFIESLVQLKH